MEATDLELAKSAAAGDDGAFHALVDRHSPALFRSALSLSRNRADAEDLLQDTLVSAYRGIKSFAGRSSIKTWLVTIMMRQSYKSRHRSRHQRATLSLDVTNDSTATTQNTATRIEQRMDVMQAMKSMSATHREVLVLREIQGLSYDEIAAALDVPRGTVESRLFRARAEFRNCYGEPD